MVRRSRLYETDIETNRRNEVKIAGPPKGGKGGADRKGMVLKTEKKKRFLAVRVCRETRKFK